MVYIVTEEVTPLEERLEELGDYQNSISYGIYEITVCLPFLLSGLLNSYAEILIFILKYKYSFILSVSSFILIYLHFRKQ